LTTQGKRHIHIHNPFSIIPVIFDHIRIMVCIANTQKTKPVWISISSARILIFNETIFAYFGILFLQKKPCTSGNCAKPANQIEACCLQKALTIFVYNIHHAFNKLSIAIPFEPVTVPYAHW